MNLEGIKDYIIQFSTEYGIKLLGAIIALVVGFRVIKLLLKAFSKVLEKFNVDETLRPFLKTLIGILLKVLLIISVLGMLGVEMTSFIAILGAMGLAIGMALSGTLQNFAGGVVILILKPFKVGDFIEAQGYVGIVKEIQIFTTVVKTVDNKIIYIPNGALSTSSLVNYSVEAERRVDFVFGIAYGDDYDLAKQVLLELINADERVINEPDVPFVALTELGDSSVNITVRVWTKSENYWGVKHDLTEKVYKTFPQKGLSIPFPQMDVHVHNS